jgi:hypothetical protein
MGYDLTTSNSDFRLNITAYRQMLTLASNYGWEPMGTIAPPPRCEDEIEEVKNWEGTYFSNNYQKIGSTDAFNLAIALEKAIVDIPLEPQKDRTIKSYLEDRQGLNYRDLDPLEFFAGRQEMIKNFITFCKEGDIWIG